MQPPLEGVLATAVSGILATPQRSMWHVGVFPPSDRLQLFMKRREWSHDTSKVETDRIDTIVPSNEVRTIELAQPSQPSQQDISTEATDRSCDPLTTEKLETQLNIEDHAPHTLPITESVGPSQPVPPSNTTKEPLPPNRPRKKKRRNAGSAPVTDNTEKQAPLETEGEASIQRHPRITIQQHKGAKAFAIRAAESMNMPTYRMVFYTDASSQEKEAIQGAGITYKCFPAGPHDMVWHDESYEILGTHNSNTAEMLAIACALKIAVRELHRYSKRRLSGKRRSKCVVFIFTDSQASLVAIGNYFQSAAKPSAKEAFLCKQSSAEIPGLLESLQAAGAQVEFRWVPGHSGVIGNTRADRLASDAVQTARPIMAYHPASPDGKDFEIISVKDMVQERIGREMEQCSDVSLCHGSVPSSAMSSAEILALLEQIKTVMETAAFNTSTAHTEKGTEPPEAETGASEPHSVMQEYDIEQVTECDSSQSTLVDTASVESWPVYGASHEEPIDPDPADVPMEPSHSDIPKRKRGMRFVEKLKKPFRRVGDGLKKRRSIKE